ncbi:hypothetical protein DICPUDRAFT_45211 [Dictyostelium purpureum]|uniref:Protein transport protein SEC23 n=1 Tax=Dictyostelium purpureum TaxID=5786 RepID=F0Z9I3_DICPU|nr:uncharacterized protein DICPUDRAFT_45211 [Dictyostelium purpureum]EGC39389.1 hypothetical protein DICPUDRAFT_45211 [Dictyostelium purpureum]|eukprot:XP_003284063.1 hypothetical protein DICPUDRAFT_45211 [Dictyostelium purpureum]
MKDEVDIDFNGVELINEKDWFKEILNYQQQNNQLHSNQDQDITQYIKNHNQFRMNENYQKKSFTQEELKSNLDYSAINQSVLASSILMLNRADQFNKTNLPNGFLLSPFHQPITTPQSYDYQPPQCKSCFSYINMYCELKDGKDKKNNSNRKWICSICKTSNDILETNNGWWKTQHYKSVFSSETFDIKIRKNKHSQVKKLNNKNPTKSIIDQDNYEEEDDEDDEYFSQRQQNQQSSDQEASAEHSNIYLFLIDENISTTDLKDINKSIRLLIKDLPNNSKIGLLTFSKNISIFEMSAISVNEKSQEGLLSFNSTRLVGGRASLDRSNKYEIQRKRRLYLETILDSGIEERSPKLNLVLNSLLETFENNGTSVVYESKQISLGVAIECALRIVKGQNVNSGRFFVFLNGAPDYGPGAIPRSDDALFINCSSGKRKNVTTEEKAILNNALQYYEALGEKAYRSGFAIDLQLIGYNNFETKILAPLCRPSGIMSCSLDVHSVSNNKYQTRSNILFENMNNAIIKNSGIFGQLDIHVPEFLNLTHLIGPTINPASVSNNKKGASQEQFIEKEQDFIYAEDVDNDRYTSFVISNLQQDICFSIYFNLSEDIPFDHIYVQFVTHLIKSNGIKITRVITKQIKVTGNFEKYLSSVDFKVIATLLSKKIILQSIKDQQPDSSDTGSIANTTQFELDKQLAKITLSCSKVEKSWFFKKTVIIPDLIKSFINLIYKVRKSLIFGQNIQNDDDLTIYQNYLLNSNFTDCQKLLLPNLLLIDDNCQFRNIPLDVCSIDSNAILILDCFINIYILVGSDIEKSDNQDRLNLLDSYIKEIITQRLPSPYIIKFNERDHEVRWLKSLLSSSESYPIDQRLEIVKEIYPQFQNETNQNFLERFNDPFTNDPFTPSNYLREINTKIYDYFI